MAVSTNGRSVTMRSTVTGETPKTPYDECTDWIYEQKAELENSSYGRNKRSVLDAIDVIKAKDEQINKYGKQVKRTLRETLDEDKRTRLQSSYDSLKEMSQKKLNCLQVLLEVASLEDYCGSVSNQFDSHAVKLTNIHPISEPQDEKQPIGTNLLGFRALSSHDCIFAASENWSWVVRLVKCIDVHLNNASEYHQFFHEIEESMPWMVGDLRRLNDSFDLYQLDGSYQDAEKLLRELQDVSVALRQWESKSNYLWERANKLVPVHLRTNGVDGPTPARAICKYETKDISIREGEDVLLLDNSDINVWRIRTAAGKEADVPALCILIPGPFREAMDAAVKMRTYLLTEWTNTLKRIGQRLICFMLLVFKSDYNDDQIDVMRSIETADKDELLRIMDFIEETMKVHWADHEGFTAVQERMLMVRMILNETGTNIVDDKSLIVQIAMLEKLMKKYKDLWRFWELYKVALETSQAPELMLIVEKWKHLQFVSPADFAKFWKTSLPLDETETSIMQLRQFAVEESSSLGEAVDETDAERAMQAMLGIESNGDFEMATAMNGSGRAIVHVQPEEGSSGEGMIEERIVESIVGYEGSIHRASIETEESAFGYATEQKSAQTEQLSSAEMEVRKTFLIRSVVDQSTDTEISLQEAILKGIINPNEGVYVNQDTGESVPIAVAMSNGLIKVEFTSTKRTQEKKSSIGIITVKTERQANRPYTILNVKDPSSGDKLTKHSAIKQGVLDDKRGIYKDSQREILMVDAIKQGMIEVEYIGEAPKSDVVSTTYAVRAVVDTKKKKTITFSEAVKRGIINKETGAFKNTMTGDVMYVGDAIMRGFLKARRIENTNSLNIDPQNKMVIDKTEKIRKKLLNPLRVINAFKKAASSPSPSPK